MTKEEILAKVAAGESTSVGQRDFAMAVCMVDLGLRAVEVADLAPA